MPEVQEQILAELTTLREQQSRRDEEIRRWGETTGETQARLNALAESVTEQGALLQQQFRDIQARMNRPDFGGGSRGSRADEAALRHFAQWESMRVGQRVRPEALNIEQLQGYNDAYRAYLYGQANDTQMSILNQMGRGRGPQNTNQMSSGDLVAGGYLISPEIDSDVMTQMVETSPMRRLAGQRTITGKMIGGRRRTGRATASWVYEVQGRNTTTSPTFGLWTIMAHELYAEPEDTQENLEDVSMDLEAWLTNELSDEFGYAENTAFVGGTGTGQPRGFTTYTAGTPSESSWDVIEQVNSGAANLLTADGLINLVSSLKTAYLDGSAFVMRRATMTACLELKTGDSEYLLRPDLTQGFAWRLLGFPVEEFADMPAVSAGNLAIGFGNWKRGYLIVDRRDVTMLRDPYTNKPFVRFYTTKRVGGDVIQPEAIKLQKISA